jgi:hypothetical protein
MKTIMERWRYKCENSGTDPFVVVRGRARPDGHLPQCSKGQIHRKRLV